MTTVNTIADSISAVITAKKTQYGADADLTQEQKDDVSQAIDEVNETWNGNLPPRQ